MNIENIIVQQATHVLYLKYKNVPELTIRVKAHLCKSYWYCFATTESYNQIFNNTLLIYDNNFKLIKTVEKIDICYPSFIYNLGDYIMIIDTEFYQDSINIFILNNEGRQVAYSIIISTVEKKKTMNIIQISNCMINIIVDKIYTYKSDMYTIGMSSNEVRFTLYHAIR